MVQLAADTPRQLLTKWVLEQIDNPFEVRIPELRDEARKLFLQDQGFKDALVEESMDAMLYQIVQQAVAESRQRPREQGLFLLEDGQVLVHRNQLRRRASHKFAGFREHVHDRHVLVGEMRKRDLRIATAERESRGDVEYHYGRMWRYLTDALPNEEDQVNQHYSDEELDQIYEDLAEPGKRQVA